MDDSAGENSQLAFLFTDIEGSMRLWEQFPEEMPTAIAVHDELLRSAVRSHGGQVFRSAGDAIQAHFPDCASAVRAAVDAQLALAAIEWNIPDDLRVRMAIHSAAAERTPTGDYRSPQLRRLETTLAMGHGGQILLSRQAASIVRDVLPAWMWLLDLGRWQLPETGRSEPIFQIAHECLPSGFPELNAFPVASFVLEGRAERFVGRKHALQELHALLDQPGIRLITLTGPGGIGKTSLAQQLAIELQADRGASVCYVELTGLNDAEQVPLAIASAMLLRESGQQSIVATVVNALNQHERVLVLDNFEHVLTAASLVADLLSQSPQVRIVVTSRIPLKLRGERQFPVEPLAVPSASFDTWEELQASEAVQLFVDRATTALPEFTFGVHNADDVAGICRKLEGLPLAIELAAPHVRVLTVEKLNERLEDRLGPLSTREANLPDRHRAMRASIYWSYELLSIEQRWFFRQLGVLQSGFTLETLEVLFGRSVESLALTEALLEQNLVQRGGFQRDPSRFFMLESVRQYALEQLETTGESDAMHAKHANYFADALLERYSDQRTIDANAVSNFGPLLPDINQAVGWLTSHDPVRALSVAEGAWRFWCMAGQQSAADRWLEAVLDATRGIQSVQRVRAIYGRAIARHFMGDIVRAEEFDLESLELARALGDFRGIGDASNHLAGVSDLLQSGPDPLPLLDDAMGAYEQIADDHGIAEVLLNRAAFAMVDGRFEDVLVDGMRVLDYCRIEGKDALASNTIQGVAEAAYQLGNIPQAIELMIEALELNRKLGFDIYTGANLQVTAGIALNAGFPEDALRLATSVQAFAREHSTGGDMIDPFGRAEEHRALMLASLDQAAIARVTRVGERLSTAEAVEQALAFLRDLSE